MNETQRDTRQKAFEINLDPASHGTFAEIGAGQEVARWLFRVGNATGTVLLAFADTVESCIASSIDGLGPERIEIDTIRFSAPRFNGVDDRLTSLQLVERGSTSSTMSTGPESGTAIELGKIWSQSRSFR